MNVYDFDKTIYKGDSYSHFYLFCLLRRPYIILLVPFQLCVLLLAFVFKVMSRGRGKELFSCYLRFTGNNELLAERFWICHEKGIKSWYLAQKRKDDVIISASPAFLLIPICRKLNVDSLIATRIDSRTGKLNGENCYGAQKPIRFIEEHGNARIACFYSDSKSDTPMAELAENAMLVKGNKLMPFFQNTK